MQIQTKVISHTFDTELVSSVEQKMFKLKRFFSHMDDVRIALTLHVMGLQKERTAEIKIYVPNGVIFIKESSKTFDIAVNKALVALKLQLLRHKAKQFSYCLIKG
jgi:putative sigma-54 modulation protein